MSINNIKMTDPTATTVGVKGKVLHKQTREIIANVKKFMFEEAEHGTKIPLSNFRQRTIAATGVSKNTYSRIGRESKNASKVPNACLLPAQKGKREVKKTTLSPEDLKKLRDLIYHHFLTEKKCPTLQEMFHKVQLSSIRFEGNKNSLWRLIRKMGFKYKRCPGNKRILIESHEARLKRIEYLRTILRYRREGRPIIYVDEVYVRTNHNKMKDWFDSPAVSMPKGHRVVVVNAGGEGGFINNGLFIFKSGHKQANCMETNQRNYEKWILTQLIPNLPPHSIIVLDSASCNIAEMERVPSSCSKKIEMINFLRNRHIHFDEHLTKPELFSIIQMHRNVRFRLDDLLGSYGHTILRLPPYHPDLNAMEKIWGFVKAYVASKNVPLKLNDVEQLISEKVHMIGLDDWRMVCEEIKQTELICLQNEHIYDEALENLPFVTDTGFSSGEDDSDLSDTQLSSDDENGAGHL